MGHEVRIDCRHFRGDMPCWLHKQFGCHCEDCKFYDAIVNKLLIIKLGAMGDVLRTTPILRRLWKEYPKSEIWWLTRYPEVVPKKVDRILPFNLESVLQIQATKFETVYNLDKDYESCALLNLTNTNQKAGFCLVTGRTFPINASADHKYFTGLDDDLNKENRKSYQEEIFEMCGFEFQNEEYVIDIQLVDRVGWNFHSVDRKVIGLNTGCSSRWETRLWPTEYWLGLILLLKKAGYTVVLLGGEAEHQKNSEIAVKADVFYNGHYPFDIFVSLVDQCDLVVSAVTTGMHVAIGLQKKVVVFNNIFNRHEFELYGRGEIIEPTQPCQCFFRQQCKADEHCMDTLYPDDVFSAIERQLKK